MWGYFPINDDEKKQWCTDGQKRIQEVLKSVYHMNVSISDISLIGFTPQFFGPSDAYQKAIKEVDADFKVNRQMFEDFFFTITFDFDIIKGTKLVKI